MTQHLVLQTDFGLQDGAVSSMYGVAYSVADNISVNDLTHGITPFNIFEGSFRLSQTLPYWSKDTVFVSVVDPGVGSKRLSIAARLKSGHIVVTPDNGTLTHLAEQIGIDEVRVIDDSRRLPGSENSPTFHGRDIYAYNGALLASGQVAFEELGAIYPSSDLVTLDLNLPVIDQDSITGNIDITDVNFGSLWTNIPLDTFKEFGAQLGDIFRVQIFHQNHELFNDLIQYHHTFNDAKPGEPLIYINSVYTVALAIHTGSFERKYNVGAGADWSIRLSRP